MENETDLKLSILNNRAIERKTMATYKTAEEVRSAINNEDIISGVIEINFSLGDDFIFNLDSFNDYATNLLIGEKYGYLLEEIGYKLVGCNTNSQTLLILVTANAKTLLDETDELSEFEN